MADRIVVRGKRRQAAWSPVLINARLNALGAAASIGSGQAAASFQERVTIARIRGTCSATLDVGAALDAFELAVGLIVVKDEAFAAGAASMPSPISDVEQSWIWHHVFSLGPAVNATQDGGQILVNQVVQIDGKAMRKVQAGETMAFVFEGAQDNGTPTADALASVRFMVLLN